MYMLKLLLSGKAPKQLYHAASIGAICGALLGGLLL